MSRETSILVVDDDKDIADMLVEWLGKKGYRATATYSGKDAVAAFTQENHDLVISDLVMPDIDGMDLLDTLKDMDPRVMVLMITGFGTIERAVAAIKQGAYDFIPKPIDFKTLEVIVDRAADRHSLFKQLGIFRGLTLALIISVPLWLILGIILALYLK